MTISIVYSAFVHAILPKFDTFAAGFQVGGSKPFVLDSLLDQHEQPSPNSPTTHLTLCDQKEPSKPAGQASTTIRDSMSSRSSSPLTIFSPKLKLVTKMLGLSVRDGNNNEPQQHSTETPDPQQYTYVMSLEGVEVRQPHLAREIDSKDGSPSSITSSKTRGSDIEVSSDFSIARIAVVEKADDQIPPLLRRRGRHLARLELANDSKSCIPTATDVVPIFLSTTPAPAADTQYTHVKHIGSGGEGDCSLVKRGSDKKLFAFKTVYKPQLVEHKPIEAMIEILFEHSHKNVIRLHDWTFVAGTILVNYYFEYCQGGDLFNLMVQYDLHNKDVPELFIWHTFLGVAGALDFLHRGFDPRISDRVGVVHRDVKPENLFLRLPKNPADYPDVVLADFGMASFEFATYDGAGSALWQPPELPRKAPKGDVWSLGAIIHYMIHREIIVANLPVDVEKTAENQHLWDTKSEARQPLTRVPEGYSPVLVELMLTACEKEHNKRISSSRLLMMLTDRKNKYLSSGEGIPTWGQLWPLEQWALGSPLDQGNTAVVSDLREENIQSATYGDGNDQYFEAMQDWYFENWKEPCPGSPLRSVSAALSPRTLFGSGCTVGERS